MVKKKTPKIVVIGGGTGSSVVLSGLKKYLVDLTAIVSVSDSGGSTGRLRTEFGFLPVGDMRQCLAALASDNNYVRKILLYRFYKGRGLKGHNLGNLILTALTDITGSEAKAIEIAGRVFRIHGRILPISTDNMQLIATYETGEKIYGEHQIDELKHKKGKKIINLTNLPKGRIYPPASKAIQEADLIILGPGDLYTSILPNLIVKGIKKAIYLSKAKIIYIVNLMTRFSQTDKFTAQDHIKKIEEYLGCHPDFVFINKEKIPLKILKIYQKEKSFPVKDDLGDKNYFKIIRENILKTQFIKKVKGDILKRSYLRHDSKKIAKIIMSLLNRK